MSQEPNTTKSDIDLNALLSEFRKDFLRIFIITTFSAILSVFYAISLPNIYSSNALLEFADKQETFGGVASGGISSQAIGLISSFSGASIGNQDTAKLIQKMKSRQYINSLKENDLFLPYLMGVESFDEVTKTTVFNKELVSTDPIAWIGQPFKENSTSLFRAYRSALSLDIDKNSNILNFSVSSKSPEAAYTLSGIIIDQINELTRQEALLEANRSIEFLESELKDTPQTDIRNAISMLISSQLSKKMIAKVDEQYALKRFDAPNFPEYRSSPDRAFISIMGTLIGFLFSLGLSMISYYRSKLIS